MRPIEYTRILTWSSLGCLASICVFATPAAAIEVRGSVALPYRTLPDIELGYTRTRVANANERFKSERAPTALFLKVKESLPLPVVSEPRRLSIRGFRFEPAALSCAVDETVEITNEGNTSVTILIGGDALPSVKANGTASYSCQKPGPLPIRVKEWPFMRGTLHVGEVGVAGVTQSDGTFALVASQGTYDLEVLGVDGVIATVPVTLTKADVHLGSVFGGEEATNGNNAPNPMPAQAASNPPSAPKPNLTKPRVVPKPGSSGSAPSPRPAPTAQPGQAGSPAPAEPDQDTIKLEP